MSPRLSGLALVAGLLTLTPAVSSAQAPDDVTPADGVPVVAISIGVPAEGVSRTSVNLPRPVAGATRVVFPASAGPGIAGAVRLAIGRVLVVEAEAGRMSSRGAGTTTLSEQAATGPPAGFVSDSTFDARESRDVTTAGGTAAVQMPLGPSRLSGFLGGGVALERVTRQVETTLTCRPRVLGGCDDRPDLAGQQDETTTRPSLQVVYGLDVKLTPRLAAFALLRWTDIGRAEFDDESLNVVSGLRMALRTRSVPPEPPEVRVTANDGARHTGRLVALSSTDVIVRRGGVDDRLPLSDVRRVETVTRRVRSGAVLGGISGSLLGFAIGAARGPSAGMGAAGHALLAGVWGTGLGALMGVVLNMTTPPRVLH